MLKFNKKGTRIASIERSIDVVLMFLLLTLNRYYKLLGFFDCWLWVSIICYHFVVSRPGVFNFKAAAIIWVFRLKNGDAYLKVKFQNFVIFSLQKTINTFIINSSAYSRSTTYCYLSVVCLLVPFESSIYFGGSRGQYLFWCKWQQCGAYLRPGAY